jgi:hypothetical protein
MCDFCESKESIIREPELLDGKHTAVSLQIDDESKFFKVRLEVGSIGYTLPIQINFCMFCGGKIIK